MADYIEREYLLRKFNIDDMMNVNGTLISLSDARNVIEKQPAADVAPARHGDWIPISDGEGAECSECGEYYDVEGCHNMESFKLFCGFYHYCPNCGAKMDGEADGKT